MHIAHQDTGRLVSAVQTKRGIPAKPDPFDKWHLCDQLANVRMDFDLSDRSLSVLKALISFWPDRNLPDDGSPAIVFPSNKTLATRLNGMAESTLRRHLAHLTRAGIVSRHDSPNHKRYARRLGQNVEIAFGFDLSPLAYLAAELTQRNADHAAQQQRCQILRDEILHLRAIHHDHIDQAQADTITRLLRRKPNEPDLQDLRDTLSLLNPVDNSGKTPVPTKEMSVSSGQNERHIQDTKESYFDSEKVQPTDKESVTLREVTEACQEYECFSGKIAENWQDLIQMSDQLAPMIGIEQPVLIQAKQSMGLHAASVAVICILERLSDIRSPGAYMRSLTKRAQNNMFSLKPMLSALINRKTLQIVS
jgi:replication initiation protein RepC